LYSRRTTSLPRYLENMAVYMTWMVLGDYFRTYAGTSVEDELRAELQHPDEQYQRGPLNLFGDKSPNAAFVVEDGSYISARWPGDVQLLGARMLDALKRIKPKT